MTTDELNAALAAKLAPMLGAAVYKRMEVYRCAEHGTFTSPLDIFIGPGLRCKECHQSLDVTDERWPKDFTDPAVLWPLWERWDVECDWTITVYRAPGDGFEANVWQDVPGRYHQGASSTEAVARAWCAALEGAADA